MGTTYYVSATDGNNNNAGTDLSKPLRSIQAAINKAQAGDNIYVRAGVYAERLYIEKLGSTAAPILLSAYQEEKPVIDGATLKLPANSSLIAVNRSQSVTIKGLEVRNSKGRGILITKSVKIDLVNCTIHSGQAGGVSVHEVEGLVVEGCRIYQCARSFLAPASPMQYAAIATKLVKGGRIEGNQIYENSAHGIAVWIGSEDITIRRNVCYDNRVAQISVVSSLNVTVDANLCYHTGRAAFLDHAKKRGPAIAKGDTQAFALRYKWHTRNLRITNNIIVGCGTGFENLWQRGKLTSVIFAHNTIVNSSEQAISLNLEAPSTETFIENNVIVSSNGGALANVGKVDGIVWRHNLWSAFPGQKVHNPASDVLSAGPGLVNLDAPVGPGTVTAEPYKLVATSVAVNKGVQSAAQIIEDYWGNKRDDKPDLGASEVPGGSQGEPDPLPQQGVRVTDGLIALYEFKEGQGARVSDSSKSGDALNLTIAAPNKTAWTKTGLLIKQPTLISSEKPAKKIIDACKQSHEITVEAWIVPANTRQDGPARIVGISKSKTLRNVTLAQGLYGGQPTDLFVSRLRTTQTSNNGLPPVVTPTGSATASLTHLVYTRSASGRAVIYVNGQERGILNVPGKMDNWDATMPLMLANEQSGDRAWLGEYRLVAVYRRAISNREVLQNYAAGSPKPSPVVAQFSVGEGEENGIVPYTVEFDSSESVAPDGIATYFWEFGDGNTSNRPNPVYTYETAGLFTVSLTITDTKGVSDKATRENYIRVATDPITPVPEPYARFVLVNISDSTILAFGVQYPDLRCALMWNRDPFHMLVFQRVEHVLDKFVNEGIVDIVWVDPLESFELP